MKYPACHINICENDHTGDRSGLVWQLQFGLENDSEYFLELEPVHLEGEEIYTDNKIIRLGKFKLPHSGVVQEWAGNMMWNQYTAPLPAVLSFINNMDRKIWTATSGFSKVLRRYEKQGTITPADLALVPPQDGEDVPVYHNPNQLSLFN